MCTIRELLTYTVALLFLSLIFAYFHNQSPSLNFKGGKKYLGTKTLTETSCCVL